MKKAILILKDGTLFEGQSFGYEGAGESFQTTGEVVFNTSMSGYQEILTDPSYKWQMVCLTYPEIGNYGTNEEDFESVIPQASALIVKSYSPRPSNFRSNRSLSDYLKKYRIPAIMGIDTRALVKHLRDLGAMPGILAVGDFDLQKVKKDARKLPSMEGMDLVKQVSCQQMYTWNEGIWDLENGYPQNPKSSKPLSVVAYDFGVKHNILRNLVQTGFRVQVVPATTTAQEVLALNPDGVFLSNGPGDPAAVSYAIENTAKLIGKVPIFGICLGHQILSLALGAKTYKLKFGHRGGNQPVMDLSTEKVEITSQNHGFAVDELSLKKKAQLTHINLNDRTVEGLADVKRKFFCVQYHPEASPGPRDSLYLFERFRQLIERG